MKSLSFILVALFTIAATAQKTDYNLKKGYVAEGYDVTEYFNNKAIEGNKEFTTTYDGAKFKFASHENLEAFLLTPEKFIPQYGGYCAYAIADKGKKVSIDPETFEIRDGKLYLFYNSWGVNTLEKWNEEGAAALKKKADIEWKSVRTKH
ncbi:YHS domain-containing (seleno)protein [Dokdonia sp. PRO95]|uniref:YHS domain-containing (seleno)protein n=1 Tax=Dokdonia sp. PRO95 TaxID=1239415 RepID=UPI000550A10D|nr:YHS domain-containing (seleno)protein [Dokdonia sp. PRO95]